MRFDHTAGQTAEVSGQGPVDEGRTRTSALPGLRLLAISLTAIWIALSLWAVGPVMRESDQASLLRGSVMLARDPGKWIGNSSYNYDKQFLSYWIVAGWLKRTGTAGPEGSIEGAVRQGNLLAALMWSGALAALVVLQRKWSGVTLAVLACVLLSPVVAFTGLLLSSNLLSAAFLLLMVVSLKQQKTFAAHTLLVGLLAFAAVGARQDAVLVMPLLAFLGIAGRSPRGMLATPVLWTMAAGCLAAIVTGVLVSVSRSILPAPFLALPTFVTYLACGLGAALLLVAAFVVAGFGMRSWRGLALAAALLVPLVFYGCLLYSPRHLFIVAVALLSTAFLPEGRTVWERLAAKRSGRAIVGLALLGALLPWVIGVRVSDWSTSRPVVRASTLYPTADGFWPLGAYAWFYGRLAGSPARPIDHNQEVWGAWMGVDPDELPPGAGAVVSSGLESFGYFWMDWAGRPRALHGERPDYVLFDDRALAKLQLSVDKSEGYGRRKARDFLEHGSIRVAGADFGRRILSWTAFGERREPDPSVSLTAALGSVFGGNDFKVGRLGEVAWRGEDLASCRGVIVAREEAVVKECLGILRIEGEVEPLNSAYDPKVWWVVPVSGDRLAGLEESGAVTADRLWVAVGVLPAFMDVRRYSR